MDRAKTVAMEKAEPLMAFIRPRMVPLWLSSWRASSSELI